MITTERTPHIILIPDNWFTTDWTLNFHSFIHWFQLRPEINNIDVTY